MKKILIAAALLQVLPHAAAQTARQEPFQAPALLVSGDGGFQRAWLVEATKSSIRYRETAVAVDTVNARLSTLESVFLLEPREFTAAMDLYQARRYDEAKRRFAEVKERFMPLYPLENSHAALAAFYEMECLRKLGDLEGLAAALQKFDKDPLTRDIQLRQLELYLIWDAVRTQDWDRVEKLVAERAESRLPGDQRAQIAWCHGQALEGLGKPRQALLAYQTAMTADAGASEEIARQAALRVMSILINDEDVKQAMKDWGSPSENKTGTGHAMLTEAAAVATLYEMTLGAGMPLPAEFAGLLKYQAKKEQPEDG